MTKEEEDINILCSWMEVGGQPALPKGEAQGLLAEVSKFCCPLFCILSSSFYPFNCYPFFPHNLVEAWYSLEQYNGLKEDKLSSTTVDFIRSEGNLETKHLYWISKPKMC